MNNTAISLRIQLHKYRAIVNITIFTFAFFQAVSWIWLLWELTNKSKIIIKRLLMDNHIFFDTLLPNQENIYAITSTSYYTYKLQGK